MRGQFWNILWNSHKLFSGPKWFNVVMVRSWWFWLARECKVWQVLQSPYLGTGEWLGGVGQLPSAGSPLSLKGRRPQSVPSQGIGSNGPRPRVKEPWTVWLASALQLNVQLIVVFHTKVSPCPGVGRGGRKMLETKRVRFCFVIWWHSWEPTGKLRV